MTTYDRRALQSHHPDYLSRLSYRCQFSGQSAGKTTQGKYRAYNFHHTHSGAYGLEQAGYNYILLKPWAHNLVHFFGGVLPWEMHRGAVRLQNRRAKHLPLSGLWVYPNLPQRLFHGWCRVPMVLKDLVGWVLGGFAIAAVIVGLRVLMFGGV